MTEHKYTDEDVIKGLECHKDYWADNCFECPYQSMLSFLNNNCVNQLSKDALDLINRQREEIEVIKETTAEIRYEAIKEFAESIKTYYDHIDKTVGALINYTIDQKLKEFLGGGGIDDA